MQNSIDQMPPRWASLIAINVVMETAGFLIFCLSIKFFTNNAISIMTFQNYVTLVFVLIYLVIVCESPRWLI